MNEILTNKTFYTFTYGCQMNEHDSERIAGLLESCGCVPVSTLEESEIVIFMTCCVRERADIRLMGQVSTIKGVPLPEGSALDKWGVASASATASL